jgi:hypothetical protein
VTHLSSTSTVTRTPLSHIYLYTNEIQVVHIDTANMDAYMDTDIDTDIGITF